MAPRRPGSGTSSGKPARTSKAPRRRGNPEPEVPVLPSREDIIAFMAASPGKVTRRDIARHFRLDGPDRAALKPLLAELAEEGAVEAHRREHGAASLLPPVFEATISGRDEDGELLATPAKGAEGAPTRVRVHAARARAEGPAPGVGDRVLLKLERHQAGEEAPAARILKVLASRREQVIGVFRAEKNGAGRVVPVDRKALGREIAIVRGGAGEAEDGDLVAVELTHDARLGLRQGRVRERLGSLDSERAVSMIAIHANDIPHVFPPEALAAAEAAEPVGMAGREDWRDLPLVTIDPADAKDHDDAVHAVPDGDPANPGGFLLTVAIADVAAYVRPGSALDREAQLRGNSVYFPDRVVPMLPERISNDLCSLRAGEDRPALALRIVIDRKGEKRGHAFHRIMMRSRAKLAYEQAQAAIDGRADATTEPLLAPVLRPLWAAYAALKTALKAREPLDLDLPERRLRLSPDGRVADVVTPERLDAHKLIEEMMVLANVCAAETLEAKKQPLVYRVHDEPSLAKMESLREFLETLDITLPKAGAVRPVLFNHILARVADSEHSVLVSEVVLRSQAQAEYAPDNYGHFGLNLRRYAHFTSPIRRYADLIVHRALIRALGLGDDGLPDMPPERLREIAQAISAAERRAMQAERETIERLIAGFLADHIGATFAGRISGVTKSGLFVKLQDTGADGFVPAATLGADFYAFDEAARALVGARTGEAHRLGDPVTVRLVEAAPVQGALRFEILSEGRYIKPAEGKRGLQRRKGADAARAKAGKAASLRRKHYGK
jgi:ribonuclease R